MKGCARGCAPLLILLLVAGAVVWLRGPELLRYLDERRTPTAAEEPSPERGSEAVARFNRLLDGEVPRVEFDAADLESILRWEFPDYLPEGVGIPVLRLRDGEASVTLRVARDLIPHIPDMEGIRSFLPDTVPLQLRGRIITLDEGDAGFVVGRLDAAGVPIPSRFIPAIVGGLSAGRTDDLPPEIVRIRLPEGIRTVRIDGDRLVLTRTE